jgi:hypothetical protein
MQALAEAKHIHEMSQPCLEYGKIRWSSGSAFIVDIPSGSIRMTKALSCLVEPRPGDTVIASVDAQSENYILAILERDKTKEPVTDLCFDGQVNLHVKQGNLVLKADGDMELATQGELGCASEKLKIHAETGTVKISQIHYTGRLVQVQIERLKTVAVYADQIFRRLTQRLESSFRFVKEQDELQAGSSRVLVEDLMTLHAKNTLIAAEENVTVNAEQIHLG